MQGRLPSKNVQYLYDALDLKKKMQRSCKGSRRSRRSWTSWNKSSASERPSHRQVLKLCHELYSFVVHVEAWLWI